MWWDTAVEDINVFSRTIKSKDIRRDRPAYSLVRFAYCYGLWLTNFERSGSVIIILFNSYPPTTHTPIFLFFFFFLTALVSTSAGFSVVPRNKIGHSASRQSVCAGFRAECLWNIYVTKCICTLCLCCSTMCVFSCVDVIQSFTYVLRVVILTSLNDVVREKTREKARGNTNSRSHIPSQKK